MKLQKDSKYIVITLLTFVGVFLMFYFFFFKVYERKNTEEVENRRKTDVELETYYGDPFGRKNLVDMEKYWSDLLRHKKNKKVSVENLKKKLEIKPTSEFIISREEKNPGSYFKKILDRKRTELLKESSRRNIEIPEDLGFGEELPPDAEAPDLLTFLFVKDQLIRIGLESGIRSITAVDHFELVKTGPEKNNMFINEYPVRIEFQGELKSVMNILYRLRSKNRFLILRNLEITSDNEGPKDSETVFGIGVSIAGMTFSEVREEDLRPKEKKKTNLPKGVPLGI
jgi:Tfp pilus assembly protein PilO